MTMYYLLGSCAVIIVAVLAYVAFKLQRKVWLMEKEQQAQQVVFQQQREEQQDYVNNSIQVLAQSLIDSQLTLTEGAIRISVLLSNLSLNEDEQAHYHIFQQLTDASAHIPILDAWKRLDKHKKRQFEKERIAIEARYHSAIIDAATQLRTRYFPLKPVITELESTELKPIVTSMNTE